MPGLKGQVREPRGTTRERRNSQNLASAIQFVDDSGNGTIIVDGDGFLQINQDTVFRLVEFWRPSLSHVTIVDEDERFRRNQLWGSV